VSDSSWPHGLQPTRLLRPLSLVAGGLKFSYLFEIFLGFWYKHLSLLIFPLEQLSLHPVSFGMLYFDFHLSQGIFLLSFIYLTCWLFSIMLFSYYIFENFPVFILQLISSFIQLSEKMLDIIWTFLNLLTCFIA